VKNRLVLSIIISLLIAALTYVWSVAIMNAFPPLSLNPEAATASASTPEIASQITRFIIVILLFAVIGYLLWKNWKRNFLWWAIAAIVYALLFHFRYVVIAQRTYSLSSVASVDDIINFTASTVFVSLAIPWWVLFSYLGIFKLEARRAAETAFELSFAVLLLLALPIGWSFALNGPLVGWTLPDMPSTFLGFICILQALIVSALGVVMSGATALVTWYQRDPRSAPMSNKRRR